MLALSSASLLGGCSAADVGAETTVASGSLELPLVGRWHAAFAPVGGTGYVIVVQSRH